MGDFAELMVDDKVVDYDLFLRSLDDGTLLRDINNIYTYWDRLDRKELWRLSNDLVKVMADTFNAGVHKDQIIAVMKDSPLSKKISLFLEELKPWHKTYAIKRLLPESEVKAKVIRFLTSYKKNIYNNILNTLIRSQNQTEFVISLEIGDILTQMEVDKIMNSIKLPIIKVGQQEFGVEYYASKPYDGGYKLIYKIMSEDPHDMFALDDE